jgi:hypothetical protein
MASLLLLNGSPRGSRSNTNKMLSRIALGWQSAGGEDPQILHLARQEDFDRSIVEFFNADVVVLGMPLYTDAMPGVVKYFIEALAAGAEGDHKPTIAFLTQSGFPEACHMRPLERYLEKLSRRIGARYAGTIVRAGGEALQSMPDKANKKLWTILRDLGSQLACEGRFGDENLKKIASAEHYSPIITTILSGLFRLPALQFYWNDPLKKNGAWERRFATPYWDDTKAR